MQAFLRWDNLINIFLKFNSQLNLSAIRDFEGVEQKHIQDALEVTKVLSFPDHTKVCDIGTGGGFPLLPLAMTFPQVTFIGIDARRKKVDAVNEMIQELHIPNAQALRTRIEEHQGQYDFITARAVGYIDKILSRSLHLLKPGGALILYKQFSLEEKKDLLGLCKKYRLKVEHEHHYRLREGDIERVVYVLKKITNYQLPITN